jgi:hypothetical protein
MRLFPEVSSDIVTLVWTMVTCGGLLATTVSFFVLDSKNYRLMFWCAVPFSAQAVGVGIYCSLRHRMPLKA